MTFLLELLFISSVTRRKIKGKIYTKVFEELIHKLYLSVQSHILAIEIQNLFQREIIRNHRN